MAENGNNKHRIKYAEICKTIKSKAREDTRKYNQEIVLVTLLDKQGREIRDQDKIIKRKEEFYTELYDSEQSAIIHTDPNEVPQVTSWEMEAALRDKKNGTAAGNDHINIETLKAGEDTFSKTLAKLYTKCLSERR